MHNHDDASSAELERHLAALREEYESLSGEQEQLESRLVEVNERLRSLKGWHGGEIAATERLLKYARLREHDATLPRVVWKSVERFSDRNGRTYVVSRVTPKRIYVREAGSEREEQFNRDGTPVGSWKLPVIDVPATLGAGGRV